jgi:hypothetical protein
MDKRDVFEVAVKMLGLYLLLLFLGDIMVIGIAFSFKDNNPIENRTLYIVLSCLTTVLYLVFAVAFLWRGGRIAELLMRDSEIGSTEGQSTLPYARLGFWIKILGLYFFVHGLSKLVSAFARAGIRIPDTFLWSMIVGETLQLALSILFIFRSEYVSQFVYKHSKSSTVENE